MAFDLFAKKDLASLRSEADTAEEGLHRALGPLDLVALGVGAIIGAGIFVLTGSAAAQYAGPAIVLSFVLSMASHFLVGGARSVFTGRGLFRSGIDMFVVGLGVAVVGYYVWGWVGKLF